MRERVTEVELRPLAALVRVAEADRRLERGAAPHLLRACRAPTAARRRGGRSSRPRRGRSAAPRSGSVVEERRVDRPSPRASGTRRRGSSPPEDRSRPCRRSPRRPARRASTAPRSSRSRACTSRRRSRRRRSSSRHRAATSVDARSSASAARAARPRRRVFAASPRARDVSRDAVELGDTSHRRRPRLRARRRAARSGSPRRRGRRRRGHAHSRRLPRRAAGARRRALGTPRGRARAAVAVPRHAIPGLVGRRSRGARVNACSASSRARALEPSPPPPSSTTASGRRAEHVARRLLLQLAERRLTARLEELGDGRSRSLLDDRVDRHERPCRAARRAAGRASTSPRP